MTLGDASDTPPTLEQLRAILRDNVGEKAHGMPDAANAIIDTILTWWPNAVMTQLAKRNDELAAHDSIDAMDVLRAKVLEDLEFHWGTHKNVGLAIDLLSEDLAMSLLEYWWQSVSNRNAVRACIAELKAKNR